MVVVQEVLEDLTEEIVSAPGEKRGTTIQSPRRNHGHAEITTPLHLLSGGMGPCGRTWSRGTTFSKPERASLSSPTVPTTAFASSRGQTVEFQQEGFQQTYSCNASAAEALALMCRTPDMLRSPAAGKQGELVERSRNLSNTSTHNGKPLEWGSKPMVKLKDNRDDNTVCD